MSGESRENGQLHTARLNANLGKQEPTEVGARKDFGGRMRHHAVPDIGVAYMVTNRRNAILYQRQWATSACTPGDCLSAVATPDESHPTCIAWGVALGRLRTPQTHELRNSRRWRVCVSRQGGKDQFDSNSTIRCQHSSARPSGDPSCCYRTYARSRKCCSASAVPDVIGLPLRTAILLP
jgi:hypothetical protein